MSVSLFENKPESCPFGHELLPGKVQIGWSPCQCEPAREVAARRRGLGHHRLHCRQCEDEGRHCVYFKPPHDTSQWHVR